MKEQFKVQLQLIENTLQCLDKLADAQKIVVYLDAVFTQTTLQKSLNQEYTNYQSIKTLFKNDLANVIHENSRLKHFQQNMSEIETTLDKILSKGSLIQRSVEDYLENKRLVFPRFFFMTDAQFLEFIALAEKNLDFNKYINLLFPGASKVILDQPLIGSNTPAKVPPPTVNDLSQVHTHLVDINTDQGLDELRLTNQYDSKENMKNGNKQPRKVMGLVSTVNELFLFAKKVTYNPHKAENWLQGTETSMQETIGKLIHSAVNTFSKQSLDQWVLDYPQQVILSTIHLILTHEINDLFQEMKCKKEDNSNGEERSKQMSEIDFSVMKTPDTRDLIKNSFISRRTISQHVSQKSCARFVKRENQQHGQKLKKISTNELNSLIQNQTPRSQISQKHKMQRDQELVQNDKHHDNLEEFKDQEYEQSNPLYDSDERRKFISNMFGSDFEIDQEIKSNEDTMEVLQEKSFRGLYLRLQFWINQICESLSQTKDQIKRNIGEQEISNQILQPHSVHNLTMQTIVNFLSYMRDVVQELKNKKVDDIDDFEWQKQMRVTWDGKDSGCKVDCGAWSTQQANEYLGAKQRIPLTPLTNKYFVFISAAFREKSAVLFKCIPSHDYCSDIFSEFSSICAVPFKEYQCNPKFSMKSLMQFLNGAALASVWIFFEHVDKLDYVHLQTFNKEIQMVQQQFIIAELSQDSSVMTAHITVGNQSSSSRYQNSNQREKSSNNDQRSNRDSRQINEYKEASGIKIEDNVDDESHSGLNESFELQHFDNKITILQQDGLKRESKRRQLQIQQNQSQGSSEVERNNHMLQNISSLNFDDQHYIQDENREEQKHDQEQLSSSDHGELKQNKICFGVFASISHSFNLQKEKWASEISTALQSAFRVLSLTKPELPIITSVFLKSEGFKDYKQLSMKIIKVIDQVNEYLNLGERDDSFTITVRDLKRLTQCASSMLQQENARLNNQVIDREEHDQQNQRLNRIELENQVVSYVLELFLIEKLQSYNFNLRLDEEQSKKQVKKIIAGLFNEQSESSPQTVTLQNESQIELQQAMRNRCLALIHKELDKVKLIIDCIKKSRPLCIIGKENTGKSEYLKLAIKDVLKKRPVYFHPQVLGSFRELYGIYDPISTTQQTIIHQLGEVKHSLFSVLKNELEKPNSLLIIDGDYEPMFTETLIPYLEYHTFTTYDSYHPQQADNDHSLLLMLPNGIQVSLRKNIPIVYELRSLNNVSPRFINSMQIVNMKITVETGEHKAKMQMKMTKMIQRRFKIDMQIIKQSIEYIIGSIILPTINELETKNLVTNYHTSSLINWFITTFNCLIKEVQQITDIKQTLMMLSILALTLSIGNALKSDGKKMFESIIDGYKSQLGIKGSIFNQYYDANKNQIVEMKEYRLDTEVIINPNILRGVYYAKLLTKHQKDIMIVGDHGSQKTTLIRYLQRSSKQEFNPKYLKIPITCYMTHKSVTSLLDSHSTKINSKEQHTLIILDDVNLKTLSSSLNILEYLRLTKLNSFKLFNTNNENLTPLDYQFSILSTTTTSQHYSQSKCRPNIYQSDIDNEEYLDFLQQFIHSKLQIQPSFVLQLTNIITQQHQYLIENKNILNVSTFIGLNNLHLLVNLIQNINNNKLKDQNLIETLLFEYQRSITDRIIYPDLKMGIYENLILEIKKELPQIELNHTPQTVDDICLLTNENKLITRVQDINVILGDHPKPLLKQMTHLYNNLTKANKHFIYVTQIGSRIVQGIENVAQKLQCQIIEPDVSKYRDSHSFVEQINSTLVQALKYQKKCIILLRDSYLNDISYIDYVLNLIIAIKEAQQFKQLDLFNSLDLILDKNLKQQLIDQERQLYNQKISHSPHSGINSSASPSSFIPSLSDNQLLMNAISKISKNVHLIISIHSLQNYQQYCSSYPHLETQFHVAFIPGEQPTETSLFEEIQQWIHEFNVKQTYDKSTYKNHQQQNNHAFNNEINAFYIPENKQPSIFEDDNFNQSHLQRVNQELNLSIPPEYTLSQERFELFKQIHRSIKDFLYKSLSSQKQFYTKYYDHYQVLQQSYMKNILGSKDQTVGMNQKEIFNLINVEEQIEKIQTQLQYKIQTLKQLALEKKTLLASYNQINEMSETQIKDYHMKSENLVLNEHHKQENKLKELKEQLSFNQALSKLCEGQIAELKEEVEDLLVKEQNMKQDFKDTMRRIDIEEVKQIRNEHQLKSFIKYGRKCESKLDKVKIRMKNLEGDSIILACSLVYLGAFTVNERMEIRKYIAERFIQEKNIEISEYWLSTQSEQIHAKYFKKIIKNDLGLKSEIMNKLSYVFVDSLFSEFLFTYLFCPTLPVFYDSVGCYQQEFTDEILQELGKYKVKVLFGSDYMIQEKLYSQLNQNIQDNQQLIFINDLGDYCNLIQGKTQDQAILHKLSNLSYHHKRKGILNENETLSLPLITLFSSTQHNNLNNDYLARATIYNATFVSKNEAWIEIKQILLKHFLPDNYQKVIMIKQQIQILRTKLTEKQKEFEQLYLKINPQQVENKDHEQLEKIRECYSIIRHLDEDCTQYNQAFHSLINEHPLLASYSNIFVIVSQYFNSSSIQLYYALKELQKFTKEITYSWKIFLKIIDIIIAKIIRDLTMNLKNKENEESDQDDNQDVQHSLIHERKKKKKDKEFTIDEEFFHSVIMPSIYSTIVAGIKQEHVPLFNLLFSLEIALKKTTVNEEDKDFFISKFFKIKNCYDWRLDSNKPQSVQNGFVEGHQRIKLSEFNQIKRDILKVYPDLRKLFETIEIKIGKEFTYKEANSLIYKKLFKNNFDSQHWKDLPLIKKINVGFICPDDEWRSMICQFVYEELTTIFDFNEDLNKLHNFIKTASWTLPIALFTSNSINIVNTVCSIASYYGVGLEVLRTDYQQSIKKHENYYQNKEVNDNVRIEESYDPQQPLSNEAACTHYEQLQGKMMNKKDVCEKMFLKDELEIDDKQIALNQSSMQLIEKCAENGTWVLISTLKFPSFWYKISRKLEKMAKKGKILNTFRLFFDLQGYSIQEIPESFLFNHCVKFYLTEKNNEDMEGFNDVWANILNDDLLNAKDLQNVPILEPPSDMMKISINLESNIFESSMESLIPYSKHNRSSVKDNVNPNSQSVKRKAVKDDRITYQLNQNQSKDTIILPSIFTQDHIQDIMIGGKDLRSPVSKDKIQNINQRGNPKVQIVDDISEITIGGQFMSSGLMSKAQSILTIDDMSKNEGSLLKQLNQAFTQKETYNQKAQIAKQANQGQPKYEMVKKKAPNQQRQSLPQKR